MSVCEECASVVALATHAPASAFAHVFAPTPTAFSSFFATFPYSGWQPSLLTHGWRLTEWIKKEENLLLFNVFIFLQLYYHLYPI